MTVQIFTTVVNRPDFVETQKKLFDKFLLDEYQFNVVDDSIDDEIEDQFKDICSKYNINYYKKPKRESPMNPAQACADAIQWTFDNIIKVDYPNDLIFFCDSDMFLLDEFSIQKYMEDQIIAGHLQKRGKVYYIWNGIMFFDMKKIMEIDPDLDFSDGMVKGQMTDVGGNLYHYFEKNNIKFKVVNEGGNTPDDCPEYPDEYNGVDLWDEDLIYSNELREKMQFELHLEGKFLHYRAGSNWHSKTWRSSNDPLPNKTKLFNQIIEDALNG